MYSSNFESNYNSSYKAQEEKEQDSQITPNYPKLTNQKGQITNFRKKSFFYDANFQLTTHTKGKPPYSYATLITYAINKSPQKRLSLNQIYDWLETHYPYLKTSSKGWKNSVRHNLSHNPTFYKVSRPSGEPGKGSLWTIDENMLNELSCKNIQFGGVKESNTPNHSPVSNSDASENFGYPQNFQFTRRSTVSDIYHPYFTQNSNPAPATNLHLARRHSQPMVTNMTNCSNNSTAYQNHYTNTSAENFQSPSSNPYSTYPSSTTSYMPYSNPIPRFPANEIEYNRQQVQVHHPFGLLPSFGTSTPPSELAHPYNTYAQIPSTPIILSSNIPQSMNTYTDDSIQYSNSNSPDYSQNPYELLTPSDSGYNTNSQGFYDHSASISPRLLL
jgi:hypothetical protein